MAFEVITSGPGVARRCIELDACGAEHARERIPNIFLGNSAVPDRVLRAPIFFRVGRDGCGFANDFGAPTTLSYWKSNDVNEGDDSSKGSDFHATNLPIQPMTSPTALLTEGALEEHGDK